MLKAPTKKRKVQYDQNDGAKDAAIWNIMTRETVSINETRLPILRNDTRERERNGLKVAIFFYK